MSLSGVITCVQDNLAGFNWHAIIIFVLSSSPETFVESGFKLYFSQESGDSHSNVGDENTMHF